MSYIPVDFPVTEQLCLASEGVWAQATSLCYMALQPLLGASYTSKQTLLLFLQKIVTGGVLTSVFIPPFAIIVIRKILS